LSAVSYLGLVKEPLHIDCYIPSADIYEYYKIEGYGSFGRKIRKGVINKALSLREFPNMSSTEPHLAILALGHRYTWLQL
jgi:hypothetical protein